MVLPSAAAAEWLAGDLHVHTCYSHDVYCGPGDDNTGPDEIYTLGLPVEARFAEAAFRGLDWLAITDHNDVRSFHSLGFGSAGVIGVPAYENSLDGHAQMLGAAEVYPGDDSVAGVQSQAAALRADGGLFQINHPISGPGTVTSCDPPGMDWGYGYAIVPDAIEVWNFATPGLTDTTRWWECWLDRGVEVPATGGSDSHWLSTLAVQGVGNPTTWVDTSGRSSVGVLNAIDAGRTSITRLPPHLGATPLVIEADPEGDGSYRPAIGERVPAGGALRISGGGPLGGLVRVRANGETILEDAPLVPGEAIDLPAPPGPGWLRAELRFLPAVAQQVLGCIPPPELPFACAGDQVMAALASPVYLSAPVPPGGSDGGGGNGGGGGPITPGGGDGGGAYGGALSGPGAAARRCADKRRRGRKRRACACAHKRSRAKRRRCARRIKRKARR